MQIAVGEGLAPPVWGITMIGGRGKPLPYGERGVRGFSVNYSSGWVILCSARAAAAGRSEGRTPRSPYTAASSSPALPCR